jgi:hypothetical protein
MLRVWMSRSPVCSDSTITPIADWNTFLAKRAEIHDAQLRLHNEASLTQQDGDIDWCGAQLLDLVASRDTADDDQRSRFVSALFESIDAEAIPQRGLS